jgi:serine/threonine protein kinase/HAMP domain-containing protein
MQSQMPIQSTFEPTQPQSRPVVDAQNGAMQAAQERPVEAPRTSALAEPLSPGHTLYEYRIDKVLGCGGFGITYLATDVNLKVQVAIKEYLPSQFATRAKGGAVGPKTEADQDLYQTWLDSFLQEARTLATFRHPNIVRVARFFEANNTAYMVLDYERGTSLGDWWAKHKDLGEAELVALLQPLLDGLAHIHRQGYLHRDIKPDNICVRSKDGSLVLLDFGSARQTGNAGGDQGIVYTPGFAPLEQHVGGEQGPWTDVYAMGATLYWMVTGGKPVPATVRQADERVMPSAVELGSGRYSESFLAAIDWALQLVRRERAPDVPAFCRKLFEDHAGALRLQEALVDRDSEAGFVADLQPTMVKRMARAWSGFRQVTLRPTSWPLVAKMSVSLVLAALLPMLITSYYHLQGGLERATTNQLHSLESLAASTAGRVGQLVGDSRNLAAYIGADEDFIEFLAQPTDQASARIVTKLLSLVENNPDIRSIQVIDTEGTALASSVPRVIGRSYKFRDYFKETMAAKVHMSGIAVGATDNEPGVYFSHPVFNAERKVIGLVSMRVKGASISGIVNSARDANGRVPLLIDGDGVLVHHPDPRWLYRSLLPLSKAKTDEIAADQRYGKGALVNLPMPDLTAKLMGAAKPGNIRYQSAISMVEEIGGFAPVPGTNWVVFVTEPLSAFEAPLNHLFTNVLYSVVLVGLIFILFAMTLSRHLVRPILQLTQAAMALKAGDFAGAHIKVTALDEIGRLARTFNVMCDVLRQRERERERANRI